MGYLCQDQDSATKSNSMIETGENIQERMLPIELKDIFNMNIIESIFNKIEIECARDDLIFPLKCVCRQFWKVSIKKKKLKVVDMSQVFIWRNI